jgi:hypothetical protein
VTESQSIPIRAEEISAVRGVMRLRRMNGIDFSNRTTRNSVCNEWSCRIFVKLFACLRFKLARSANQTTVFILNLISLLNAINICCPI